MQNYFNQQIKHNLRGLYYFMAKVNKSILTGETCFLESNFALQYAHKIDYLKANYPEEYKNCDWLELVRQARKQADEDLRNE